MPDRPGTRVVDVVGWRTAPTPVALRAARWAGASVEALVAVVGAAAALRDGDTGALGDLWPERPGRPAVLPDDPDEALDLPVVTAVGAAPWLPRPALGPQPLVLTGAGAWRLAGPRQQRVRVPLEELVVVAATAGRRRHPTARWRLRLAGPDGEVVLRGAWLSLAWIGHLAGWAEPARRGRDAG